MLSYKRRICSDTPRWPELVCPNRVALLVGP